jgi:RNA polymerase sigma-70 factor (sigma-E family)
VGPRWGRNRGGRDEPPPVDPAFVEFVAARSAALFRTAVLITGDRHAAEDLVQSALERAFRSWDRVAAADAPEAYVRRIMANLANDQVRRRSREAAELLEHDAHSGPDGPVVLDAYRGVDEREAVIRALRELPVRMRTVLVLRYFDDLTEVQIAEALGIAPGTVKSQAARGLAKLRAVMEDSAKAADAAESESLPGTIIQFPQGGAA